MILRVSYILLLRWFAGFCPSNEKKHISDGRGAGFGKFGKLQELHTWRTIPITKWLGTLIYMPYKGHLEGEQPYLGVLIATYKSWDDPPSTRSPTVLGL